MTKEENQTQMKPQEQTHMVEEEGEKITHQTQIKNKPRNKPTKTEPISTPTLSMSRFPHPSSLPPLLLWFVT